MVEILAEFLLARIAESEDTARRAAFGYGAAWTSVSDDVDDWSAVHADGKRDMVGCEDRDVTRHIARHDPARVLAECAAKRQAVSVLVTELGLVGRPPFAPGNGRASRYAVAETTLCALSLAYADHPDYREEWRP